MAEECKWARLLCQNIYDDDDDDDDDDGGGDDDDDDDDDDGGDDDDDGGGDDDDDDDGGGGDDDDDDDDDDDKTAPIACPTGQFLAVWSVGGAIYIYPLRDTPLAVIRQPSNAVLQSMPTNKTRQYNTTMTVAITVDATNVKVRAMPIQGWPVACTLMTGFGIIESIGM